MELCDACGVRASWVVWKGDLLLTFCGHHVNKFSDGLDLQGGWDIRLLTD